MSRKSYKILESHLSTSHATELDGTHDLIHPKPLDSLHLPHLQTTHAGEDKIE